VSTLKSRHHPTKDNIPKHTAFHKTQYSTESTQVYPCVFWSVVWTKKTTRNATIQKNRVCVDRKIKTITKHNTQKFSWGFWRSLVQKRSIKETLCMLFGRFVCVDREIKIFIKHNTQEFSWGFWRSLVQKNHIKETLFVLFVICLRGPRNQDIHKTQYPRVLLCFLECCADQTI